MDSLNDMKYKWSRIEGKLYFEYQWISQDWKCPTGIYKCKSEIQRKGQGQGFSFGNHQYTGGS